MSVVDFLEVFPRLTLTEHRAFFRCMVKEGIRVDTEATDQLLKEPIGRVTSYGAPKGFVKVNLDAALMEGKEITYNAGAIIFTDDTGNIL